MEIVNRADAIKRNLREYFTGLPCKNGHLAKRYTQSSACYECIHPNILRPGAELRESRAAARRRMVVKKFRISHAGINTFMAQAYALALSYEGSLQMSDLETRGRVFNLCSWAGIYPVRIFPEMEPYLRPLELQRWEEPTSAPALAVPGEYWPEGDPR